MKIQDALFLFVIEYAFALDQRGTEFVFSFIDPQASGPKDASVLIITADSPSFVSVTLLQPSDVATRFLKQGETWKVKIPAEAAYTRYNFIDKMAVSVSASTTVSVYAQNGNETRRAGFLVLPTHMLSTSYVAVTCGGAHQDEMLFPVFLIVGVTDKTDVVVKYKISEGGTCEEYLSGESSYHSLGAFDVIGIRCSEDFTGTYITSSNPVAVISGHQKSSCQGLRGDFLEEMLLPVEHFGVHYIVPDNIKYPHDSFSRVTTAESDSVVTTKEGDKIYLGPFSFHDVPLTNCHECITATAPVGVVSFGKSRLDDKIFQGNTFMYIVPPVDMYSSFVRVDMNLFVEAGLTDTFHVLVVMKSSEAVIIPGAKMDKIRDCGYSVYSKQVKWPLVINLTNINMAAFIYGGYNDLRSAIGIPLNMRISEKVTEEISTSSVMPLSSSASLELSALNGSTPATTDTSATAPTTLVITTRMPALPVIGTPRLPPVIIEETAEPETIVTSRLTSSAATTSTERNCQCICIKNPVLNISDEFLETLRKKFEDLLLNKRNLSKTIRKMVCARDNRPSAVGVGYIGVGMIICAASCIVVPDLLLAVKTYLRGKCIKRRACNSHTYHVTFSQINQKRRL